MNTLKNLFIHLLFLLSFIAIPSHKIWSQNKKPFFEFKRGDIIAKANSNWIPGTTFTKKGFAFGHVAIVVKGASGKNIEDVLSNTIIFESHSRNVPPEHQVRKVKGYDNRKDHTFFNDSFSKKYTGKCYRLRPNLSNEDIEALLKYILKQDDSVSSWRTLKKDNDTVSSKKYWYCSLLIYQAFKDVLNIDLDANGGAFVFPNDIINSPFFNSKNGRVIF